MKVSNNRMEKKEVIEKVDVASIAQAATLTKKLLPDLAVALNNLIEKKKWEEKQNGSQEPHVQMDCVQYPNLSQLRKKRREVIDRVVSKRINNNLSSIQNEINDRKEKQKEYFS